jgi:CBS domain containing-hemolysin-like protein
MEPDSIGKIVFIAILVLFSAYFSATETAFSTLNRIRLKNAADNGDKKAGRILALAENYDKLITTVLVGNNIVNILASSVATVLFIDILRDNNLGSTVSTVVMTVVVLIFGEVCPKSFAKESPEKFARFAYPFIALLCFVLTPVSAILIGIRKLASMLIKSKDENVITEDEIITFVEEAELEGGIDEQESELIRSAVEFNDLEAQEILTHRVDIIAISDDEELDKIDGFFRDTGFSRLPVYNDTIDNIVGVIHHKDFYNKVKTGEKTLGEIVKKVVSVHKSIKIGDLLRLLQKEKSHIAVVADDYGGTLGIVTMEDIIEELVGEIWDEHDEVVEEIVELEENRFKILCTAPIDKVFEKFDINDDIDEASVGGWVMSELDKIPEEGDSFSYRHIDVAVTKTESRRVIEIEITVNPETDEDSKETREEEKNKEDN